MKCESYMLHNRKLYKRNYEGIYLKCLGCEEVKEVLEKFQDKYGTGHGSAEATAHIILGSGYFWPTIFKDTFEHVRTCHIC
jgi:predicted nucleotidyltransferase